MVITPDDGFLTTQMMPRSSQTTSMLKAMLLGSDVGFVYRWSHDGGWSKVPGTDAPFPNGIALSPDGQSIYVNIYLGDEVRHIDLQSGELLGRVDVAQPDNITWSADRRVLLVASHTGGFSDSMTCFDISEGSCGMAVRDRGARSPESRPQDHRRECRPAHGRRHRRRAGGDGPLARHLRRRPHGPGRRRSDFARTLSATSLAP